MKIEIHHIPSPGVELADRRPAKEFGVLKTMIDHGECGAFDPIDIQLKVTLEGDMVVVQGQVSTTVQLACSRCAEPFGYLMQRGFTLRFSQQIPEDLQAQDDPDIELTADQIGLIYFKGDTIDFKDAIQEQIVLALPYKPLCREECKGLCPRCGADLNLGACRCGNGEAAGPFALLKNVKLPLT